MGGFCSIKFVQDDKNEDSLGSVDNEDVGSKDNGREGGMMKIWCKDCRRMFYTLTDPAILNHSAKHEIIFDF
jgi:hypothetical protein